MIVHSIVNISELLYKCGNHYCEEFFNFNTVK